VNDWREQAEVAVGPVTVRVRYAETDRMGVAYHAHYLAWFEIGRTELMRVSGCTYRELEEGPGLFLPVIEAGARYHAPARYDDVLRVHTRIVDVGAATVKFEYRVTREDESELLATGFTEHALVGGKGRAVRLPWDLRQRLLSRMEGPA